MPAYTQGIPKSGMLEIGIALTLHDQFTTGMDQASKEVKRLYRDAKNGVMANLNAAVSVGEMGENFFGGMISAISEATNQAIGYLDTMTSISAITEATVEQTKALQNTARRVGFESIFSIPEVASGMKYLAMAGASSEEIQAMIGAATNVAGATGLQLGGKGGAADVITNVMRTFQQEMYSASDAGDIMTKATLRSNMSMADMAASIRYASADITNLGYDLRETSAMIGTLGNMGIQGSMAGTALANMARYLGKSVSDSSYKGHSALKSIGLGPEDLTDAYGNLLQIDVILEKIQRATQGMTSVDRSNIYTQIFGVRGNRAATALTRDLEGYRDLLKEVTDSAGYAADIMKKRMDSLFGIVERFNESMINLKTIWVQTMEPILGPLIKAATKWLQGLGAIMESKIFGPIIGFLSVGIPLVGRFISTLVKWRAMFLLITRTDTLVTLKNVWAVLTGGWSAANANANGYLATLRAIQTQHAVMAGQQVATATATAARNVVISRGGITYTGTPTQNGRGRHVFRDDATGRIISRNDPRVQRRFADVITGAGLASAANLSRSAKVATSVGKIGVGVASVGRGLMTMMGGPWGLAITGISIALPYIIGSIRARNQREKANSEALRAQTQATDWNTRALGTLASKYDTKEEADKAGKTLSLEEEMRALRSAIQNWTRVISTGDYNNVNLTISTPDGKVIKTIDFDKYNRDQNLALGTK